MLLLYKLFFKKDFIGSFCEIDYQLLIINGYIKNNFYIITAIFFISGVLLGKNLMKEL